MCGLHLLIENDLNFGERALYEKTLPRFDFEKSSQIPSRLEHFQAAALQSEVEQVM